MDNNMDDFIHKLNRRFEILESRVAAQHIRILALETQVAALTKANDGWYAKFEKESLERVTPIFGTTRGVRSR